MSFWIVLAAMVRPYAIDVFQSRDAGFYENRYSFPMSFAGVLYWMVVLGPWATARGIRKAIVVAFLVLNVTMSLHRFNIGAYGPERRWQATVNALERSMATGCPATSMCGNTLIHGDLRTCRLAQPSTASLERLTTGDRNLLAYFVVIELT